MNEEGGGDVLLDRINGKGKTLAYILSSYMSMWCMKLSMYVFWPFFMNETLSQ